MGGVLLGELAEEQLLLLREVFVPWDRDGEWPVWQYIDYRLYSRGLVAAEVLRSLPVAGGESAARLRYGLTWNNDNHWLPNDGTRITLTLAGLWHLRPESESLLGAFTETFRYLAGRIRTLEPSPSEIVEVSAGDGDVGMHLVSSGVVPEAMRTGEGSILLRKLGQILEHEPFLWSGFMRPAPDDWNWSIRLSRILRDFGDVATAEEYISRVEEMIGPEVARPAVPPSSSPLDIPYAVGYLDAVWKARAGWRLFLNLDPASVARLTQQCGSEEEFNSLMSALADVLGQVVAPGIAAPPQREALERVRDYLLPLLDPAAGARVTRAFGTLIRLRQIRVSTQHADARHKAVEAFREIGLRFPPPGWDQAWTHIAVMARGALDVIREEVHAGHDDDGRVRQGKAHSR